MVNAKLEISPKCLGDKMYLVDTRPDYEYVDGVRGKQIGVRYDVALPNHKMDKLTVKIAGDQQAEVPEDGCVPVTFDTLNVRPYVDRSGHLALTATATGIHTADATAVVGKRGNPQT